MSVVLAIPIAVVVGGCSGASAPGPSAAWPSCAAPAEAITIPTAFDPTIPLPADLRVATAREAPDGGIELTALARGSLADIAAFFSRNLPAAGFAVSEGESGATEAEATFSGPTSTGRLVARPMSDCQGVVELSISATSATSE